MPAAPEERASASAAAIVAAAAARHGLLGHEASQPVLGLRANPPPFVVDPRIPMVAGPLPGGVIPPFPKPRGLCKGIVRPASWSYPPPNVELSSFPALVGSDRSNAAAGPVLQPLGSNAYAVGRHQAPRQPAHPPVSLAPIHGGSASTSGIPAGEVASKQPKGIVHMRLGGLDEILPVPVVGKWGHRSKPISLPPMNPAPGRAVNPFQVDLRHHMG